MDELEAFLNGKIDAGDYYTYMDNRVSYETLLRTIAKEDDGVDRLRAFCALDGIKVTGLQDSNDVTTVTYEYKWVPSDGGAPRWDPGVVVVNTTDEKSFLIQVIMAVYRTRFHLYNKKVHIL